jgi:hypothetical protein
LDQATRKALYKLPYLPASDNLAVAHDFIQRSRQQFTQAHQRDWLTENKNPFSALRFSLKPETLLSVPRSECTRCSRKVPLFCYDCLVPGRAWTSCPVVALPVGVDIVVHPKENIRRSTSLHACVLAPAHCRLVRFPDAMPEYDFHDTVLLFPDEHAFALPDPGTGLSESRDQGCPADTAELTSQPRLSWQECRALRRIVAIEAPWQKAHSVAMHPQLRHLRRLQLRPRCEDCCSFCAEKA